MEMFIATVPIFPFLIPFYDKPTLARRMNIAVTLWAHDAQLIEMLSLTYPRPIGLQFAQTPSLNPLVSQVKYGVAPTQRRLITPGTKLGSELSHIEAYLRRCTPARVARHLLLEDNCSVALQLQMIGRRRVKVLDATRLYERLFGCMAESKPFFGQCRLAGEDLNTGWGLRTTRIQVLAIGRVHVKVTPRPHIRAGERASSWGCDNDSRSYTQSCLSTHSPSCCRRAG